MLEKTIYDTDSVLNFLTAKGQMILKGLFGVLQFSQKTNERIRHIRKN
jgi:hypothetical protein